MSERRHLFIDEAGDTTLFDRKGRTIVGTEGCSHTFIVGVARIADPVGLADRIAEWRRSILDTPEFQRFHSLRPSARKTALVFHAKDDPAPVRMEILRHLAHEDIKVIAAVRRKAGLAGQVQKLAGARWKPNSIYDDLVKRVLKNELHLASENEIVFARRGKSDRQGALTRAIRDAQRNFERSHGIESKRPCRIVSTIPSESPGLQAIDYHLWAIQRIFERADFEGFETVRANVSLVMDLDDTRSRPYGEWYTRSNPLQVKKLAPVTG